MARWPWQSNAVRRDAGNVHRHQHRRHAMRGGLDRAGATEDDGRIGLVGGRDRGLLAVDHVLVSDALDPQAQIRGIRAATRLRQRNRKQRLAACELLEPRLDDLGQTVLRQDLPVQGGEQVDVGNAEIGARDLLVDDAGGKAAQALAPEGLRQLGRDESHLSHFAHQASFQLTRPVALQETGCDAVRRETARVVGERDEVFVEIGIHGSSPGCALHGALPRRRAPCSAWSASRWPTSRTCGTRACAFPSVPPRPHATLRCRRTASARTCPCRQSRSGARCPC